MKILSINMELEMIDAITSLVGEDKIHSSRSELIRVAVRDQLKRDLANSKKYKQLEKIREVNKGTKMVNIPIMNEETGEIEYEEHEILRRMD